MKNGFRQSMAWLHTWSGLLVGWVLFLIFAAGTAAYWRAEITFWMQPEKHAAALEAGTAITPQQQVQQVRNAVNWMHENASDGPRWFMSLPGAREPAFTLFWARPNAEPGASRAARFGQAALDASGQPQAEARETRGGDFLYRLHFDLHYLPPLVSRWIVGFCAMFMLVAIVSGIVTHKRIFADFFTFRPKKGQRSWLDAHNATAVLALPYHLMITYTGLCTLMFMYMPWAPQAAYGEAGGAAYQTEAFGASPGAAKPSGEKAPLTDVAALVERAQQHWGGALAGRIMVENQGDAAATVTVMRQNDGREMSIRQPTLRFNGITGELLGAAGEQPGVAVHTYNVMEGLHAARFANAPLRWLFFLCGLMGCAMVATGLLLWAVKERPQHLKALKRGEKGSALLRVVDGLNLGVIGGLPVAVAAYFWANRLLPAQMADRPEAEIAAFFTVWGICFVAGLARPAARLWKAMLAVAGTLFALVPLLNAATGGAHWGQSVPGGLWRVAGFDAACLLLGLAFWAAVRWLRQREAAAAAAAAKTAAKAAARKPVEKPAEKPVPAPAPAVAAVTDLPVESPAVS